MGKIAGLYSFPLVSGRPTEHEQMPIGAFGPVGDREFVAALPPEPGSGDEWLRMSQKKYPRLALAGILAEDSSEVVEAAGQDAVTLSKSRNRDTQDPDAYIDEFGDLVPVVYLGYRASSLIRSLVGTPTANLFRKHFEWMSGATGPTPAKRGAAPLHVVSLATISELQNRALQEGRNVSDNGGELRANIVIDEPGIGPFEEASWVGRSALAGDLEIYFNRATPRCSVTGIDQISGERKNAIPRLYKDLEKDEHGRAIIGVYAVPKLSGGETTIDLGIGQAFELD